MHPVEVAGSVSDPGAMESSFLKPSLVACHSDSPSGRAFRHRDISMAGTIKDRLLWFPESAILLGDL